jgi:hypothetical protein
MMGHWTTGLLVYGLITTVVTVILASLYAHCGNSETVKDVRGNSNSVSKTEIGLINIDNGQDNFSDEMKECNCGLLQLNWTVLEILVVGLIGLLLIGGFIKGMMHLKKIIHKRNAKAREEKRKLDIEMRERIRNEIATTMTAVPVSKTADPNQTQQTAITMVPKAPEIAQISYP